MVFKFPFKSLIFLFSCITLLSVDSFAQAPGDLDPSFSNDGIVTTAVGNFNEQIYDMAITSDNKIVAAGQTWNGSNNDIIVIRYNTDGTLDNSFSSDGIAITPVGTSNDYSEGVALQSDGKIVVSGYFYEGSNLKIVVLRYNTNGTLDATFDGDGKRIVDLSTQEDMARDIQIQNDGKIVICGKAWNGSNYDALLARFNTNGSFDLSFNSTGYKLIQASDTHDYVFQLEIQPDGKIVSAGYTVNDLVEVLIIRVNPNGTLDNSFGGGDGISLSTTSPSGFGGSVFSVELQNDGKIVLAGGQEVGPSAFTARMFVARYDSDGSFDESFANNGVFDIFIATIEDKVSESISDITIQSDGKIVASASSYYGATPAFFLVLRITSAGTLDNTFGGGDGYVFTDIRNDNQEDVQTSIEIDNTGKIIVGGYSINNSNNDVAIARYLSGLETSGNVCSIAPTGLFADNITSTKANLHWSSVAGVTKYKIQFRPSGTTAWTTVSSTSNVKALSSLSPSTTYQYRVRSVCSGSSSPWSSIATFTTLPMRLSENEDQQLEVSLFPNPAKDIISVTINSDITNGDIIIYDVNGKLITSEAFSGSTKIDVSSFSSGIYMIQLKADNVTSHIEKIVIE
jgi:uncharacterized delta-60 repeat protein